MPRDSRLDEPADLPSEFKGWLPRFLETELRLSADRVYGIEGPVNNLLPWLIDIDVYMTALQKTNWDTNTAVANTIRGYTKDSSGAQNDAIGFDVVLGAGVWTFELMHRTSTDRGIYTVALTQGALGTIDGYTLGSASNVRSTITGINVREPIKQRLTLTMATKNASSSSYIGSIQAIQFRRTS